MRKSEVAMPIAHVKVDICKYCEHEYRFPCHGKDKECGNRRFIEGGGAMKVKERDPVPAVEPKKGKKKAPKLEYRFVRIMDDVEAPACTRCGVSAWIVDGDGEGKHWLLCIDPKGLGCNETQELPDDVRVVE